MTRKRGDGGRYTETATLADVIDVFGAVDGPVITSGDVAETLDCSRETARRKLRRLEEQGRVASRKTAGRVVWWQTESGPEAAQFDSEDPLFAGEALIAPDNPVDETEIDEVLYGRE